MSKEITISDIDKVIKELNNSEDELFNSLGINLIYSNSKEDALYSYDYKDIGNEFFEAILYNIYKKVCNRQSKLPNEWVLESTSGDIKDAITPILLYLINDYSLPLAVSIPITALLIKRNIKNFCNQKINKPKRSYKKILLFK